MRGERAAAQRHPGPQANLCRNRRRPIQLRGGNRYSRRASFHERAGLHDMPGEWPDRGRRCAFPASTEPVSPGHIKTGGRPSLWPQRLAWCWRWWATGCGSVRKAINNANNSAASYSDLQGFITNSSPRSSAARSARCRVPRTSSRCCRHAANLTCVVIFTDGTSYTTAATITDRRPIRTSRLSRSSFADHRRTSTLRLPRCLPRPSRSPPQARGPCSPRATWPPW